MEFIAFPKIPRFNREIIITEKIDGTNACVIVSDDGKEIAAQSRTRLITPENDNFGFARWVQGNKEELLKLGPGHHFGEWWGQGVNRNYGLPEKRFSLFNVSRWENDRPACCSVVPTLLKGTGDVTKMVDMALEYLREKGSMAAPGFMNPEGVVVFHTAANSMFKVTLVGDESYKGKA